MSSIEEVDAFYSENYRKLMNYIKNNKRGGDHLVVQPDAALEILHDTYCYHRLHPEHFNSSFIWNILKQRRVDYIRKDESYNSMKDEFYKNSYTPDDWLNSSYLLTDIVTDEMKGIVSKEVERVKNPKHKQILTSHILNSEKLAKKNDFIVVKRFKTKVLKRYGEGGDVK